MPEPLDRTDQENREPTGERVTVDFDPGRPVKSYLYIIYIMVSNPRAFFGAMSVDGGYKKPWLFAIISIAIPFLWVTVFYRATILQILYLMSPVGFLIFAGGLHFSATKLLGGRGSFQATFRVVAYTSFTIIFGPIPYLGLAFSIYGLYLTAHGMAAVHGVNFLRGVLIVLVTGLTLRLIQEVFLRMLQYQMQMMG